MYIIKDWAGNVCFDGKTFNTFEDASGYLSEWIESTYPETIVDEDRFYEEFGEYFITIAETDNPTNLQ